MKDRSADTGESASPDPDPIRRGASISRRRFLVGAGAAGMATLLPIRASLAFSARAAEGSFCSLPASVRSAVQRGWVSIRSGDLHIVPHGFNYMNGGISHSTPWPYTQHVPMLWFGPKHIRAGSVKRGVTSADIAPTMARLIGFPFDAPDGDVMHEALIPGAPKPRLVIVLVWDAGGRYVLGQWPNAWPYTRSLIGKGTWFENAVVGTNPSHTAPVHATIGTGAFPFRHGVAGNPMRLSTGAMVDPWSLGPRVMRLPTLADEYGAARNGRAITGMVGPVPWHLGMLGHGAQMAGHPRPTVVLKRVVGTTVRWGIPDHLSDYYRFPAYANDLPRLDRYWWVADHVDGVRDGKWRGHSIRAALGGWHTPARIPFQSRLIEEVIKREGFGHHDEPDLLFLNHKIIDEIGHEYSASSVEMRDVLTVQDRDLRRLLGFLDQQVGKGKWVLLLTADHGHSAATRASGGVSISMERITSLLRQHFDRPGTTRSVVLDADITSYFLNKAELEANHQTVSQFAGYLNNLTPAEYGGGIPPSTRLFEAVFPTSQVTASC